MEIIQFFLKKGSDGSGHLSNDEALELFKKHKPGFMSHLILSHLSKNNNDAELVRKLFNEHAEGTEIVIASRDGETKVFSISYSENRTIKNNKKENKQLSLF
jgi:phosphoribosyl 1,2-cyclic phosphodiesterase